MDPQLTVRVFDSEETRLPDTLKECLELFEKVYSEIPEEFQDKARVDLDYYDSYGDIISTLNIEYTRPLTEEEADDAKRLKDARKQSEQDGELQELRRLQAKYGQA